MTVSCQDWKEELVEPWRLQYTTYANVLIKQCQFHPSYFPTGVGLACDTEILLSFCAYGVVALLITNVCLLDLSQSTLLTGNMEEFMLSVTFMQGIESSFNYQSHPSFIGST